MVAWRNLVRHLSLASHLVSKTTPPSAPDWGYNCWPPQPADWSFPPSSLHNRPLWSYPPAPVATLPFPRVANLDRRKISHFRPDRRAFPSTHLASQSSRVPLLHFPLPARPPFDTPIRHIAPPLHLEFLVAFHSQVSAGRTASMHKLHPDPHASCLPYLTPTLPSTSRRCTRAHNNRKCPRRTFPFCFWQEPPVPSAPPRTKGPAPSFHSRQSFLSLSSPRVPLPLLSAPQTGIFKDSPQQQADTRFRDHAKLPR